MKSRKKVLFATKAQVQAKKVATLEAREAWVNGEVEAKKFAPVQTKTKVKRLVVNLTEEEHALLRMYCAEKRIFICDLIKTYLKKTVPGMDKAQ